MSKFKIDKRFLIQIILFIGCIITSYLFFKTYAEALTTSKLFTSDLRRVISLILSPIIYFSFSLYLYLYLIIVTKNLFPLFIFPITFLVSLGGSLLSLTSMFFIFVAFVLIRFSFFRSYKQYKSPRIYRSFNDSNGIPFIIISIVLSINFYPVYNQLILKSSDDVVIGTKLYSTISNYFKEIEIENKAISDYETLETYSKKILTLQKKTTSPADITLEETRVLTNLGVVGKNSDSMTLLLNNAIKKDIRQFILTYGSEIKLFIPLAFFFITQTFSQISSYLTLALIWITEYILRKRNIDIEKLLHRETLSRNFESNLLVAQ